MNARTRPSVRALAVLTGCLLGAGIVMLPLPAHAEVVCVDDGCDSGLWAAARGAAGDISYWGMGVGHNCTNYVAWKLTTLGVERPETHPGDAGDWALNAIADGYVVNDVPAVGAVAQWDVGTPMGGAFGHVAFVERVNDDGTVLVSEDYWRVENPGPLTFRVADVASISNFIHYGITGTRMRAVASDPAGGWRVSMTGFDARPTLMTSYSIDGATTLVVDREGELVTTPITLSSAQFHGTGITGTPTSLSATAMRDRMPFLMTVERGELVMYAASAGAWHRMPTGVRTRGEIAAVDLGGLWPTVLVSEDGALFRVWNDMHGWHVEPTGLPSAGRISGVVAAGVPQVFGIHDGFLHRSWLDDGGWHQESTGVAVETGSLTATVSNGIVTVYLATGGTLLRVTPVDAGWLVEDTGIAPGSTFTAVSGDAAGATVLLAD